jgi:hypothetical protein
MNLDYLSRDLAKVEVASSSLVSRSNYFVLLSSMLVHGSPQVLRKIERRNALTTAEKCRTWLNQLFRYAMVEVNLETNPANDLDIVAIPQAPVTHNPFLRMNELPTFLCKL